MRNLNGSQDEHNATCANCGAERFAGDLLYDEWREIYVCDRECFDEWHDDNAEVVGDYYWRMNIE